MLKRKVLVTGISNLSDARYCAGMFVDYLCFELNEGHKDFIPQSKVLEIKNWLSGPKIGGRIEEWPSTMSSEEWESLGLDFLVITNPTHLELAKEKVSEIFYEVSADSKEQWEGADHILLRVSQIPNSLKSHSSIFAGNDITGDSLEEILENDCFNGVALKGSHEVSPGESTYDDLMDVLEALEEEY